ncbi:MAG: hypothetical protein WCF84_16675 [Anaerolineae bacterium]
MRAQPFFSAIVVVLILLAGFVFVVTPGLAAPPRLNCSSTNAAITSPASGATVNGVVQVEGTAALPSDFQYYKLEFSPQGRDAFTVFSGLVRQSVNGGQLAVWDSASVPDGSYSLRLRVVDTTGNYCEALVTGLVVQNSAPVQPTDIPATPAPTETEGPVPTSVVPTPLPTILILGGQQPGGPAQTTGQPTAVTTRTASPGNTSTGIPGGINLGGISGALGDMFSGYMRAFIFGALAMAGIMLVVGVIFYVRRVL